MFDVDADSRVVVAAALTGIVAADEVFHAEMVVEIVNVLICPLADVGFAPAPGAGASSGEVPRCLFSRPSSLLAFAACAELASVVVEWWR